jgi:hypothetical protein
MEKSPFDKRLKPIYEYIAEKVLEDLETDSLDEKAGESMRFYPMNNFLRDAIIKKGRNNAVELVLKYLENKDSIYGNQVRLLVLMISKPVQDAPQVKKIITDLWDPHAPIDKAFTIIYRLLEYEDVTQQNQITFLKYIKDNWPEWRQKVRMSYSSDQSIIDGASERITNPMFGDWKKWIYWIEIAACQDKRSANNQLEKISPPNDSFLKEVYTWTNKQL